MLQAGPTEMNSDAVTAKRLIAQTETWVPVTLTSAEQQAWETWQEVVLQWGWRLHPSKEAQPHGKGLMLALPAICGRLMTAADFKAYLHQLLATGGRNAIPAAVQRILASLACRRAYMFGDSLSVVQGQDLVDRLKAAQLWFQCAHGRPTAAPLVDLRLFRGADHLKARRGGMTSTGLAELKRRLHQHLL